VLDDHCDKLAVDRRRYRQLTDDGPVYHALGVRLCRAKLFAVVVIECMSSVMQWQRHQRVQSLQPTLQLCLWAAVDNM